MLRWPQENRSRKRRRRGAGRKSSKRTWPKLSRSRRGAGPRRSGRAGAAPPGWRWSPSAHRGNNEAFGLSPGVDAVVRVPEMPGRNYPGTVTRIADALQPGTRTLLIEIDVANPDHALTPGTYCTVELQIPRKTPSLIVPSEAIIFNRDGLSVAVVEGGVAHIRRITEVRDFGTTVEVSQGVKDGAQVILNPPVDLTDGRKVEIRPAPPAQGS